MSLKEKILNLRNEGKTYNEIKDILGCSKSTISYHCKSYSIEDIKIDKESIMNFFKSNNDVDKTIEHFNISKSKLSQILGKIKKINCSVCNSELEVSIFCPQKCCSDECRKVYKKEYLKNKKYNYNDVKNWRLKKKKKAIEYKGGKCEKCGYDKCISAMEFHHLNPLEKDFSISSNINMSYEKIKKELDKCILVCANCHREIHEGMHP